MAYAKCFANVLPLLRADVCWSVLQKYQDDLADLPDTNGSLQATLYSVLTVALVASGAAYLLQPQVWASSEYPISPCLQNLLFRYAFCA